jgi:hypothetical protein
MGVWGAGLYQDDAACDVRSEYRGLIARGVDEPDASAAVFDKLGHAYSASVDVSEHDEAVVWLALAETQHKLGRSNPVVRRKALDLIESDRAIACLIPLMPSAASGASLDRADGRFVEQRRKVLAKLRETLLQPVPAPKKLTRKRFAIAVDFEWRLGQVYAYRGTNKRPTLLVPFASESLSEFHDGEERVETPLFYVLDWPHARMPRPEEIVEASVRMFPKEDFLPHYQPLALCLYSAKPGAFPVDRLSPTGIECQHLPSPVSTRMKPDRLGAVYLQDGRIIAEENWEGALKLSEAEMALFEGVIEPSYYLLEWRHLDDWLAGRREAMLHHHPVLPKQASA